MREVFQEKIGNALDGAFPDLVEREIALPVVPDSKAHAIIGMRRAGKTYFLHQCLRQRLAQGIERDRLIYVNFEDERLAGLQAAEMGGILEEYYRLFPSYRRSARVTFCFDEVQAVPGWEAFVRRIIDEEDVEVLFSGSSARLLSREVATAMRGRAMETMVTPYSFREFLTATGRAPLESGKPVGARRRSELERAFGDYLATGGFPEATGMGLRDRIRLIQAYVDAVLFRDIVERHGITNVTALRALTRHLIRNVGTQVSINKLFNDFRSRGVSVSKQALLEFYSQLEDCFLVRRLQIHSHSDRRRQANPRKVYLADHSLASAFQPTPFADRGHHLENVIACELLRRFREVDYVKTRSGYEVDFMARSFEGEAVLIQVAADVSEPATLERECRALAEAAKDHQTASLLLITELDDRQLNYAGSQIRVVPAWRWLCAAPVGT